MHVQFSAGAVEREGFRVCRTRQKPIKALPWHVQCKDLMATFVARTGAAIDASCKGSACTPTH